MLANYYVLSFLFLKTNGNPLQRQHELKDTKGRRLDDKKEIKEERTRERTT